MADFFTEKHLAQLSEDGYVVLENFLSDSECDSLRARCNDLINSEDFTKHPTITFNTKDNAQASTDYFLSSGDKIRYFFEEGAIDKEGKLTVPIHKALNKIGHALHIFDDQFKAVTFSDRVKAIIRALSIQSPAVPQSMYIFKQPTFGGTVQPHQDATFLYTSPNTLIGFWIALENADTENGCLWFIPKSHKSELHRRMFRTLEGGQCGTKFDKPDIVVNNADFKPCPVRKGSLVLIHDKVIHKSEENQSDRSRNAYAFHVYDAGISEWSDKNWLQPTEQVPFPNLY